MNSPILSTKKIKALHRGLLQKRYAIPKLQRNFVWDANRAARLLDSIYNNMPIGSIFLWEMDRKSAHLIRQSSDVLPSFDSSHADIFFVIDGQQRLSVIYQAFEGELRTNDKGSSIDFKRLCFVVKPDKDQETPPRIVYRKSQGTELVSLHDLLAADWQARMPTEAKWFAKRIRECRSRLLNYPVPVVTVTNASLQDIGEVFIRVNAQGMRITSADRAIALMGELDIRAMAEDVRRRVREQVFKLGGIESILMGFNLVTERPDLESDPPKLEAMARRWSKRIKADPVEKDRFKKLWDRYQKAYLTSVDYIHRHFHVHDENYLPSANMIATLAVFFYYHAGQPTGHQPAEIKKWFWSTGVAQRYSGRGYHHNIAADAHFFAALAGGANKHFVFRDFLDPVLDIQSAEYASRSARTRAFFCLLAANKPHYLVNGDPIPLDLKLVSPANRRHRHHIFPQAQLRHFFSARVYNSLCNICFLVSDDNLAIGAKSPHTYLRQYKEGAPADFKRIMRSHLIPVGKDDGVWITGTKKAFKRFRSTRLKLICDAFERQAGIQLFTKTT